MKSNRTHRNSIAFSAKNFIKDVILYKEDYNFYEFLNIFGILD